MDSGKTIDLAISFESNGATNELDKLINLLCLVDYWAKMRAAVSVKRWLAAIGKYKPNKMSAYHVINKSSSRKHGITFADGWTDGLDVGWCEGDWIGKDDGWIMVDQQSDVFLVRFAKKKSIEKKALQSTHWRCRALSRGAWWQSRAWGRCYWQMILCDDCVLYLYQSKKN